MEATFECKMLFGKLKTILESRMFFGHIFEIVWSTSFGFGEQLLVFEHSDFLTLFFSKQL